LYSSSLSSGKRGSSSFGRIPPPAGVFFSGKTYECFVSAEEAVPFPVALAPASFLDDLFCDDGYFFLDGPFLARAMKRPLEALSPFLCAYGLPAFRERTTCFPF